MPTTDDGNKNIRVLVADDIKPMREKIVQLLGADFEVVGTAADGSAALDLILLLKPDIAVLDISMPAMSGIEVAAELQKKGAEVKIVMLTVHEDPDYVRAAFNAGASSYVIKPNMATDLLPAVRAVSEGHHFISPNCTLSSSLITPNNR